MRYLLALFGKARHSAFYRWLLNRLLWRAGLRHYSAMGA